MKMKKNILILLLLFIIFVVVSCKPASESFPLNNTTNHTPPVKDNPADNNNITSLLGFWESVSVYHWKAGQWVIDLRADATYTYFALGGKNCPSDGKIYLRVVPPQACYLVEENHLTLVQQNNSNLKSFSQWNIKDSSILEIDTYVVDGDGAVLNGIKTRNIHATKEKAQQAGWPYTNT